MCGRVNIHKRDRIMQNTNVKTIRTSKVPNETCVCTSVFMKVVFKKSMKTISNIHYETLTIFITIYKAYKDKNTEKQRDLYLFRLFNGDDLKLFIKSSLMIKNHLRKSFLMLIIKVLAV